MQEPDAETLAAATRGDPAALNHLLERYLPGLRAFVRLRAGVAHGREEHSDIVQSACRDVLENLERHRYGGDEGFRRWLYRTALRKIADRHEYYHAKKRDIGREGFLASNSSFAGGNTPTPSQHAIANEEAMRIDRALNAMPEDYREVVVLSRYVGLSHKEIADEMGRSELAVRTLLSRALARLAELLDEDGDDDA